MTDGPPVSDRLPEVLDTDALRAVLGFRSRSAVLRLHRREGLPLARVGRRWLVSRGAFLAWLDGRAAAAAPPPPPAAVPAAPAWAVALLKRRGQR